MKNCSKCGYAMADGASFCQNCGAAASSAPEIVPEAAQPSAAQPSVEPQYMSRQQSPVVQYTNVNVQPAPAQRPAPRAKNGFGVAGFVLSLLGLILAWIPFVGVVGISLAGLGVIFAIVGLIVGICRKLPIGLSIAAIVIGAAGIIGGVCMVQGL